MKVLTGITALLLFCVSPALAGEVSQDSLASLGLGGMQTMTDAQGMEVRGSAFVSAHGASLVFGQLATEDFKNFVVGSSGNQVAGTGDSTATGTLTITKTHAVVLDLTLNVTFPDMTTFMGAITASAGGAGSITVMQP